MEIAHGGRGPPPAVDRYSGHSSGGGRGGGGGGGSAAESGGRAGGVSRRSEYRGITLLTPLIFIQEYVQEQSYVDLF